MSVADSGDAVVRCVRYGDDMLADRIDVAELAEDELVEEVAELASHIYAGTCRWLELVGELDRRASWAAWGCRSCAEWLAWRCALTPRSAREHVRVARRLPELPLVHAAFASGELSYAKVRALARVAVADTEAALLDLARAMTAAQLERSLAAYRRVTTEEAQAAHEDAYLAWSWGPDGCLEVRGRLAPEEGAVFVRGLEAARAALRERGDGGSAEPRRPKNVEAVVVMADTFLAHGVSDRVGGERYQVVVHVDGDALVASDSEGCVLEDGIAVAPETARRIACDAALVRSVEVDGEPLSVGRRTRTIPPALRRALRRRDGRCRFPGCENRLSLDAHHVEHWAHGGPTSLDNLVLLCRRHHQFVHEGGYRVQPGRGGRVRFLDPRGSPLDAVPRPPPGTCGGLVGGNSLRGLSIDPDTCASGDGDRLDLDLAVDALLQIYGQPAPAHERTDARRADSSAAVPA
jgi:hypothetical protein